jgi:hypothetical protein
MRHEIGVRNSQLSMISMELVLLHFRRYSLEVKENNWTRD